MEIQTYWDLSESGMENKSSRIISTSKTFKSKKEQIEYIENGIKEIMNFPNVSSAIISRIQDNELKLLFEKDENIFKKQNDKLFIKLDNEIDKAGGFYNFLKENKNKYLFNDIKLSDDMFSSKAGENLAPALYFINFLIDEVKKLEKPQKKITFKYTAKMKDDLNILLDKHLLNAYKDKPDFENKYHAVALFDLWHEKFDIFEYSNRKNKIIEDNILVNGKSPTKIKDPRSRLKDNDKYKKQILEYLPHLNLK